MKRQAPDHDNDEAQELYFTKRQDMKSQPTRLCEFCSSDQVRKLIRGDRQYLRIPDVKKVWSNPTCPMCELLTYTIRQGFQFEEVIEASAKGVLIGELYRRHASGATRVSMEDDTVLFTQLEICLTTDRAAAGRGTDRMLLRHDWLSSDANRIDFTRLRADTSVRQRQQRTLSCDETFSADTLAAWLHDSDSRSTPGREQGSHAKPAQTLQPLVRAGRFRLINVRNNTIETMQGAERYFALSYVWGECMSHYAATRPDFRIQVTASKSSTRLVNLDKTPQTIKDTIDLVRALGETYLWVDAFCIDQHDSADKGAIIAEMGSIYRNAYLTIIAADGDSAGSGLGRLHTSDLSINSLDWLATDAHGVRLQPAQPSLLHKVANSVWGTRAWTYQEEMLSERCVYFMEDEVHYTCPTGNSREAYTLTGPQHPSVSTANQHIGQALMLHDRILARDVDRMLLPPFYM